MERQLDFHQKPLLLLSEDGFWQPLLLQFERMIEDELLRPEYRALWHAPPDARSAFAILEQARNTTRT